MTKHNLQLHQMLEKCVCPILKVCIFLVKCWPVAKVLSTKTHSHKVVNSNPSFVIAFLIMLLLQ